MVAHATTFWRLAVLAAAMVLATASFDQPTAVIASNDGGDGDVSLSTLLRPPVGATHSAIGIAKYELESDDGDDESGVESAKFSLAAARLPLAVNSSVTIVYIPSGGGESMTLGTTTTFNRGRISFNLTTNVPALVAGDQIQVLNTIDSSILLEGTLQ